jgi:hypothetical protein
MPTLRRRNRDAKATGRRPLRSSLTSAAWAVEDRIALGVGDFLHATGEVVRRPFERASYAIESFFVWPIREETDGWSQAARYATLCALALLAAVGIAAGILVSDRSEGGGGEPVARSAAPGPPIVAKPVPRPQVEVTKPAGPQLHGVAPDFGAESGGGVPESARREAAAAAKATRESGVSKVSPEKGGKASAKGGADVAGPDAIVVAREFAGAFVLYETGRTDSDVKKTFARTASPQLSQALLKRPPRLPAGVKVPKAKVLNVVSGPKQGDTYNLSVSLLRVGATSELKLEMRKVPGGQRGEGEPARWLVTDVRG